VSGDCRSCGKGGDSKGAVGAGAEEDEEGEVAEDLELLANFVADVGVDRKTRN